jgi:hypothetical protein
VTEHQSGSFPTGDLRPWGTLKKSTETRLRIWFSRKVRQVWEGGFRCRTIYWATVGSVTSIPNLSSSPVWIRGAPNADYFGSWFESDPAPAAARGATRLAVADFPRPKVSLPL